jgi:hypothetical protein
MISRARRCANCQRARHSKELNVPKEELLEFEGLVTEILPDARYRVQPPARRLYRWKNEKEPDQNPGRRSRDGRSITL